MEMIETTKKSYSPWRAKEVREIGEKLPNSWSKGVQRLSHIAQMDGAQVIHFIG